jgi:DNA-binding PadR family transcriptional regulator
MARPSREQRLKPRAFQILLILADGEQHGWNIVKALQAQAPGERILPGSLYRTLNEMTESGLIEALPGEGDNARRRNLRITPMGVEAARREAGQLEELVGLAKSKRLFFPEGSRA